MSTQANFKSEVFPESDLNPRDPSKIIALKWNNVGNKIAYSKTDLSVRVWRVSANVSSKKTSLVIPECHEKPVGDISWDPKNELRFVTIGRDQYIRIWEVSNTIDKYNRIDSIKLFKDDILCSVRYSIDGAYLLVTTKANIIRILNCQHDYKEVLSIKINHNIFDVNWSTLSNDLFFVPTSSGSVMIFKFVDTDKVQSIELVETLMISKAHTTNAIQTPDGKLLVVGSRDGQVSVIDMAELTCIKTLSSIDEPIGSIDISNDSKFMTVTGEYDECAKIYELPELTLVHEIKGCKSGLMISIAKFSPINNNLICHSGDLVEGQCTLLSKTTASPAAIRKETQDKQRETNRVSANSTNGNSSGSMNKSKNNSGSNNNTSGTAANNNNSSYGYENKYRRDAYYGGGTGRQMMRDRDRDRDNRDGRDGRDTYKRQKQ